MIEIQQVKTRRYRKPVNTELARLIQKAIEFTDKKYGKTEFVFVDDNNPGRSLQYTAIKHEVLAMIFKENRYHLYAPGRMGEMSMNKYDKMIEENQERSKEKIETARRAIYDMMEDRERITVPK